MWKKFFFVRFYLFHLEAFTKKTLALTAKKYVSFYNIVLGYIFDYITDKMGMWREASKA